MRTLPSRACSKEDCSWHFERRDRNGCRERVQGHLRFLLLVSRKINQKYLEGSRPTLPDLTVLLEDIVSCCNIVLSFLIIKMMTRVILRVQLIFKLDELLGLTS